MMQALKLGLFLNSEIKEQQRAMCCNNSFERL